jgi:flagellin-specific chaperone FliS
MGLYGSNPLKKKRKEHDRLLSQAEEAMEQGDEERYDELIARAEVILKEIEELSLRKFG